MAESNPCPVPDVFSLDPSIVRALRPHAEVHTVPRRGVVFLPEDHATTVHLIESGQVKLSRISTDGRAVVLGYRRRGDVVGEGALRSRQPYQDLAECCVDSTIWSFTCERFEQLLLEHVALMQVVLQQTLDRHQALANKVTASVFQSVSAKLADELLRRGHEPDALQTLTHQDLAHLVGSTRETVSATLSRFRRMGLISGNRGSLTIRDPEGLRQLTHELA